MGLENYACVHCGRTASHFNAHVCPPMVAYAAAQPDPRDARIAELEAALAGLVDARSVSVRADKFEGAPKRNDARRDLERAVETAERALGRRK